ncbi:MAG: hypothetical protein ACI33K_08080 [Clostridiaceae bacterium]
MNKKLITLTIAAALILTTACPALASQKDCKDSQTMDIKHNLENASPNNTEEKPSEELKLTKEQEQKRDALLKEISEVRELIRGKQQEVGNLRREIKQKLDNLSTQGKKLTDEQYSNIKSHLDNISSIQQGIDKERLELAKNHNNHGNKSFDILVKELEETRDIEKKRMEKLEEIHKELNEVKKIIG